jgi:hypothetical protein
MTKFFIQILTCCALILTITNCKTVKHTSDKLPKTQMQFGSGGGFVGKEMTYVLLQNGQIFMKDIKGNYTEMVKISEKKAKKCFKTSETLANYKCNDPGNVYQFMGVYTDSTSHKMVWGGTKAPSDTTMHKQLTGLFDSLSKLVKEPTPKQ